MSAYIIGMNTISLVAVLLVFWNQTVGVLVTNPDWEVCRKDLSVVGYTDPVTIASLKCYVYRMLCDAISTHGMNQVYLNQLYDWTKKCIYPSAGIMFKAAITDVWDEIVLEYDRGKRDFPKMTLPVNLPFYLTHNDIIDLESLNKIFMRLS